MKFPKLPKGPKLPKVTAPLPDWYRQEKIKAGKKGGSKRSAAKTAANRRNCRMPAGPGKKSGRPTIEEASERAKPRGRSLIIDNLPTLNAAKCRCGFELVLPVAAVEGLAARKPWPWQCPDCKTHNRVDPDPLRP